MPTEVLATPRAEQQIRTLSRKHSKVFENFLNDLAVGPHDDQDPVLNVYAELYRLLGAEPLPDAGRDKPPCCDQIAELPPILGDALTEILDRAMKLRRTRQSR